MKTLDPSLLTELGLTTTRPGYLVKINFSYTLRLSTLGNITFDSQEWVSSSINVAGISHSGNGKSSSSITISNIDTNIGTVLLAEGASDKPVSIYACYAGAINNAELIFTGVTDGCEIDPEKVVITLSPQANKTLFSPRVFIGKPVFNYLQPVGTKITFNGETYVLER